jgi:hypothetical protein
VAKFATSFASVVDTGGKLPPVSTITAAIIKTNMIEDFYHLPPVSTTPVVHLEL